MSEKITVPTLGESVTEATVSKWLKSQGDKVVADEPIVELETDKVNVEVPAPSNGILGSIAVKEGETVNVGSLLGIINDKLSQEANISKERKNYKMSSKIKNALISVSDKENIASLLKVLKLKNILMKIIVLLSVFVQKELISEL